MENEQPMVSICIPTYNQSELLKRLLDSIMNQTYQDFEVIVSDDSGNAEVQEVVSDYLGIRYYHNEKTLGAIRNYNQAMMYAEGKYIKVMGHDDWFTTEGSLKCYVEMMEKHPEADIGFSGTVEELLNGVSYERYTRRHEANLLKRSWKGLFLGVPIGSPSAVIWKNKRQLFDVNVEWFSDIDFYADILKRNPHFVYTQNSLVSIGYDGGCNRLTNSGLRNPKRRFEEGLYLAKKHSIKNKRYFVRLCKSTGQDIKQIGCASIGSIESWYILLSDKVHYAIWRVFYFLLRKVHCD